MRPLSGTSIANQHPAAAGYIAFVILTALTVAVYWPGLAGPFLFDDSVHIVKNPQVHIKDLSAQSLNLAWHSSLAPFPSNRPLAMLSFGINHALYGLSPRAFKGANLAIHLFNGWLLFLLTRVLARLYLGTRGTAGNADAWAILVAGLWLLHPIHLSTVLYVVQRMTEIATLCVLAGLLLYAHGRRRMARGRPRGWVFVLLSPLVAGIGFLAKENAVLFPLYALVVEITLFSGLRSSRSDRHLLGAFFVVLLLLPLLLGLISFMQRPDWILAGYAGRPFDLSERLLTETRALWFYLRLLLVPDLSALGLHHDDFPVSHGLLNPWSTLPAALGWLSALVLALITRRRLPLFAFGILFFLAGHVLESSIIPLELVFEHRNYLPAFGPLFVIGYIFTLGTAGTRLQRVATPTAFLLLALFGAVTYQRAADWGSEAQLVLSEAKHHPDSPRAVLHAARLLISTLPQASDQTLHYRAARRYLEQVRTLAPDNLDALFGLIVLNLYVQQPPETAWVEELKKGLRTGRVGPTRLTTSHFSYLVRWHMAGNPGLSRETLLGIFEAALSNPRFDRYGRAGILSALRAYYDQVLDEPAKALEYALQAVHAWPRRWHYRDRLIRLLAKLGRLDDAHEALDEARHMDSGGLHAQQARALEAWIEGQRASNP